MLTLGIQLRRVCVTKRMTSRCGEARPCRQKQLGSVPGAMQALQRPLPAPRQVGQWFMCALPSVWHHGCSAAVRAPQRMQVPI